MGVTKGPCRFRVLGAVGAARPTGGPIALRSSIRRRLLAVLLSRPFTDLTADRLMDQVWGEDAPMAPGPLHIQVSRLRRELGGDAGGAILVTVPGGYRLQVDRNEIDWLRFVDLVQRARSLVASSPDDAVAGLSEALSLWSGPAFEGALGRPDVDDQARYLDALRRSVSLELAGLAGSRGRLDDAVDLLAPMHAAEPFDEDVAALLAQALCRRGQADRAAAIVETTTTALRQELGIDSSAQMRELMEVIRSRPDDVAVVPPREVATPKPVVLALPAPPPAQQVVGRDELVRDLVEVITGLPGPGFLQLLGPHGSGKTTVAVALAHELRRARHLVRFATCTASPAMVAVSLRSLFSDLMTSDPPTVLGPDDIVPARESALALVDALADRLDAVGASGPVIVIADDVAAGDSIDQLALRELARTQRDTWHAVVVLTARAAPWPSDAPASTTGLPPLTVADIEEATGDRPLAEAVHRLTEGQPLAVGHLLGRLRSVAPHRREEALEAAVRSAGEDGPFAGTIGRTSPSASAVLEVLVVAGHPIVRATLATVLEEPEWELAEPIAELVDEGLVVEGADASLRLTHHLVGDAVRRRTTTVRTEELRSRLIRRAGDIPDEPSPGPRPGDDHIDLLVAAAQSAVRRAAYDEAVRIADVVNDLTVDPARRIAADQSAGSALVGLGDAEEAMTRFERARHAASDMGDQRAQADAALGLLGNWNAAAGPAADLLDVVEESLRSVREPAARALVLSRAVSLHQGSDSRCRAWAEEAEALAASVSDPVVKVAAATASSQALLGRPDPQARLRVLRRADRWAPERVGIDRTLALLSHAFVAACEAGSSDLAAGYLARHQELADRTRRPLHRWRTAVLSASLHMASREVGAAAEQLDLASMLSRRFHLTDGRMTEMLGRAALALWASESDSEAAGPLPWISEWVPHVLTWGLDAAVHAATSPSEAAVALGHALEATEALPPDYISWAAIAATALAAARLGEDAAAAQLREKLRSANVVLAVLAIGTATIPCADA